MEKTPLTLHLGGARDCLKVKGHLLLGLASEDRLCHSSPFPHILAQLSQEVKVLSHRHRDFLFPILLPNLNSGIGAR